jgi:FG-GAP-like repeat/FG-GAP repeat
MVLASSYLRRGAPHRWVAGLAALASCWTLSAGAGSDTLTVGGASAGNLSNQPATILFPVARGASQAYDTAIGYHAIAGSAVAGADYTTPPGTFTLPASATSANIPIMLNADTRAGSSVAFQLQIDNASRIVPAPTFAAQTPFATESNPFSVAATDVNGDGKADLIVANLNAATVSVLLNTTAPGAAAPAFAAQQAFVTGSNPFSVAATDVNGDGKADLIVANTSSKTISVLLNTTAPGAATPSFAAQQAFATGSYPRSVAATDVNGDGNADLIVAIAYDPTVSVLLNATYRVPVAGDPATGTIVLDKIFHDGTEPPLVNCAGTSGYADYLIEDFAGSSLDPLRWAQNTNSGTVTVAGNSVALASNGNQFPFVTSRGAPIPATGSFSIRWNAAYAKAASRGDGALVISQGLPANGPNDSNAPRRADVWQDTANGYQLRLRTTDAGAYAAVSTEKPPQLGAHDVEYCWLPASIEYWIDGVRVLQQARDSSLSRPDALWFGNPVVTSAGAWNNFTLHSLHVRSISP